jgi:hypothetical protein
LFEEDDASAWTVSHGFIMTLPRTIDKRHLNLRAVEPLKNTGLKCEESGISTGKSTSDGRGSPLNVVWCESLFTHRHSPAKHEKRAARWRNFYGPIKVAASVFLTLLKNLVGGDDARASQPTG